MTLNAHCGCHLQACLALYWNTTRAASYDYRYIHKFGDGIMHAVDIPKPNKKAEGQSSGTVVLLAYLQQNF